MEKRWRRRWESYRGDIAFARRGRWAVDSMAWHFLPPSNPPSSFLLHFARRSILECLVKPTARADCSLKGLRNPSSSEKSPAKAQRLTPSCCSARLGYRLGHSIRNPPPFSRADSNGSRKHLSDNDDADNIARRLASEKNALKSKRCERCYRKQSKSALSLHRPQM